MQRLRICSAYYLFGEYRPPTHRWVDGKPQFWTQWEGAAPEEKTWEAVGNFVHRYSYKLLEYCRRRGIRLDLAEHLSGVPLEVFE
jgi:hypothetical protein